MISHAEFRKWQDRTGSTLEAEYIKLIGDKVWVRDREETLHKLGLTGLSENDQLYLQLQNPPEFRLKFKTEKLLIHKPETYAGSAQGAHGVKLENYYAGGGPGENAYITRTDRPSYTCSIDVKRKDGKCYEHPLHLRVYWTSVKQYPPEEQQRLGRQNAIVLKRQESKIFKPDTIEYGQSWVWDTDPADFIRKERTWLTRHKKDDTSAGTVINGEQYWLKGKTILESDLYFGILVVVVDERGETLAMSSDKPKLEEIHQEVMQATLGQVLTGIDSHD
ncbi:MAG: hypothetical protein DRP64_03815 [Verrucomicrobia bacterium]|nr:MAG: hypothetical protein DRP64_03815 [Verrucomicrobiota bacterium]